MKKLLLFFVFLVSASFLNEASGQSITYSGCQNAGFNPEYTLTAYNTVVDDGIIRNTFKSDYNVGAFGELIIIKWDAASDRWEISFNAFDGEDGPNNELLYFSSVATYPNPPDINIGAWTKQDDYNCDPLDATHGQLTGDVEDTPPGPTAPTITAQPANRTTCIGSNTTFSISASNAASYQWQVNTGSGFSNISNSAPYSGATTATLTITGATAGMNGYPYRCVATNGAGSITSNAATLSVPTIITSISGQTDVSCNGGSNGSATISASGGSGSYSYVWSPSGGTGAMASGLTAGEYTVTVTDDNTNCTATQTVTITQPTALTVTPSQTDVSCNGGSNGTATVTVSGGTEPYSYSWSPSGGTAATATGLAAGTYTVTITDNNACQTTSTVTITEPPALSVTPSQTNVSCNGGSNGTATATVSGGTAPYSYSWSPAGGTAATATGLAAGTYTVTITDNNACQTTSTVTITEPPALSVTPSQTDVSCNGGSNGTATATVSGGTAPYTYSWSPSGGTGATATGLAAGNYTVTITDNNNCQTTQNFTITQPTSALSANITAQTNVSTYGGSDGSATISVSGGTPDYQYSWSPSGGTGATANGLSEGTYTVTITDANSCVAMESVTITQPPANVAPVVTTSGGTTTFTEGDDPVSIDAGLAVSDPDNLTLASATISITGNFISEEDVLSFINDNATMGNITSTYNTATGTLTLTSAEPRATTAQWQAALRTVSYDNSSVNPNANNRTIDFVVNDGDADSNPAQKIVEVENINIPPIAVADEITTDENIPVTGNVLTNDSDPDGNALTASLVTAPVNGTVVLNADGSFTYTPNDNYHGQDSLIYQVCDNGTPSLCDTATARFMIVDVSTPVVDSVEVPADGYYHEGDALDFTVRFSENVMVTGIPYLELTVGSTNVHATYISGNGDDELLFQYTAQGGDQDMDGIALNTLNLNSGTISDAAEHNATLTLNGVANLSNVMVNTTIPTVAISTTAPSPTNSGFTATITFSETVTGFTLADIDVTNATISNLQTSDNIMYTVTVTPASNGVVTFQVPANAAQNIGENGNSASNTLNVSYDGTSPLINSVAVPANGYYQTGNVLTFTVNTSEDVVVNTSAGTPYLELTVGTQTRHAVYIPGSTINALTFTYTVQADDQDLDGVTLGSTLVLNGGTISDAASNNAELTLNNVAATNGILIYSAVPSVSLTGTPRVNSSFTMTVTFSEVVTGFIVGDINATNATISNLQTTDNITYTVLVTPAADGAVSLQVPADAAKNIADIGNTVSNTLSYNYDATAPAVPAGLEATPGNEEVTLNWTANTESDLDSYKIYGGTTANPTTLLETVNAPLTTYTQSGLTNGTVYYYRITAVDDVDNESEKSNEVDARPKGNQTITFEALADRTYGDAPFALTATASSGLAVSYISSDPSVASVSGNELTVHKAGTVEITASQGGNDAYNAAAAVVQALTINPKAITVTAEGQTKVYGEADPALTYMVSPALASGDSFTGALTREKGEDVGSYAIGQGKLALDANYELTFEGAVLEITASAGIEVTFESGSFVYDGEEHRLTISGKLPEGTSVSYTNNVRTDVGYQEVTASIDGGENYRDTVLTATLTITPAMRSINFGELPEKTYGDNDFEIGAVSSSGEEVSYRSSNTAVAEVTADGLIHITGAGETTITAIVPENGNYSSRPSVNRTLRVRKARQEISFREVSEVDRHAGSIPLEVEASSGLPVSLQVSDEQVATVSGTELNILRLGTVVITASQAGDSNYEAAEAVSIRIRVTDPNETLPVTVHRALSPNGDGINEFLMVEGIKDYPENKLTVVDRNGMKITEMEGYNNEDKVFRGLGPGNNALPTGTYYYLLEVKVNGEWKFKKGYFVIRY